MSAPLDDRNHFTVHRFNEATGNVEAMTFKRGDAIKLAIGKKPYRQGVITGISQAKRQVKVCGEKYGIHMGYAYLATYDEFAKPRAELDAILSTLEKRLDDGNCCDAQWFIDSAHKVIVQHNLGDYGKDRLHELQKKAAQVSRATSERITAEKKRTAAQEQAPKVAAHNKPQPLGPIEMTMEKWKAIHKDFKGIYSGQRTVLRGGVLRDVVIIKPQKTTAQRECDSNA